MADNESLFTLPIEAVVAPAKKTRRKNAQNKVVLGPRRPPVAAPPSDPALLSVLEGLRDEMTSKIAARGHDGMQSFTRSQDAIRPVHKYVKLLLTRDGSIRATWTGLEVNIQTEWGNKKQDVVAQPGGFKKGTGESTLSIGVKGHLYGDGKNIINSFYSVRGELTDFHEKHAQMVCGHVHVVALSQWDPKAAKDKRVAFRRLTPGAVATIVHRYSRINGRTLETLYRASSAERTALLLVDFDQPVPLVYTNVADLEADGWLDQGSKLTLNGVTLDGFVPDLLREHNLRFQGNHHLP